CLRRLRPERPLRSPKTNAPPTQLTPIINNERKPIMPYVSGHANAFVSRIVESATIIDKTTKNIPVRKRTGPRRLPLPVLDSPTRSATPRTSSPQFRQYLSPDANSVAHLGQYIVVIQDIIRAIPYRS